jgi:hypothetical protein
MGLKETARNSLTGLTASSTCPFPALIHPQIFSSVEKFAPKEVKAGAATSAR